MLKLLAALLAQSPAAPCTPEVAMTVTVEAINTQPGRWLDQCVTVRGVLSGLRLFTDLPNLYRGNRFVGAYRTAPADELLRLGVDNQQLWVDTNRLGRPLAVTVTGRIDSCARRAERVRARGGIPFLGGYCHYFAGQTLVASSYSIHSGRFARLMGEAARLQYGSLVPLPSDWRHRAMIEQLTERFLSHILTGAPLPERLSFFADGEEVSARRRGQLVERLRGRPNLERAFFISPADLEPDEREREAFEATFCFCLEASCEGKWPISHLDADAAPDRPYLCGRLRRGSYRGAAPEMEVNAGEGYLDEPGFDPLRP